jgi:fibronectin type 3 domain-containing protein
LNAIAGNAQVSLTWNLCFVTTGYNLQRSTTSGGPYTNIVSQSGTSYTDSGLDNGTTYYYVLSATNAGGQSANSSEVSATPVAPPPPVVLTVGPQTAGQFNFSFQGQSNQNYVVETSTNLTDWSAVLTNATPDGQFLFTDTNATAPARFYRVSQ